MRSPASVVLVLTAILGACAHYTPQPVEPAALATRREQVVFDPEQAAATCRRLAPTAPCDPQSLDRLMLYAILLDKNPQIAAARRHVDSAQLAARASKVLTGARLSLTSEYARDAAESSPWLFAIAGEVPLDVGSARAVRLGSADLAAVTARYDLMETIWSARMALVRGLAQMRVSGLQGEAANELVAVQERRFAAMDRRVVAGEASRAELERLRIELADAHRRSAEAGSQRQASLNAIAVILGIVPEKLAGKQFVWEDLDVSPPISPPNPMQRSAALLVRADILKSMTAYELAELELRGEISKQFPSVTVGPGYTWERGLVKIPFSLGLSLPPLDLNRGAIAVAEARRREAGARLEADYATAAGLADSTWTEADAARKALAELRRLDLPTATRLAIQADHELAAGALDRSDWGAAQAGRLGVRLLELDALARVLAAEANVEDALRQPLAGPELMMGSYAR